MKYNQLGKSEIQISEVAFGCMSLQQNSIDTNTRLIHKAIDFGINFFDTADLYDYGENEVLLGNATKHIREQVVIATKVGNKWNEDRSGWNWDVSANYVKLAVDQSLKRLQTDYIDLYQIHGGTKEDNFEEVVDTLENLVAQGKIKAYGISSIRPNVFLRFAKESNIVSNMMQFSLLDSRPIPYIDQLKSEQVSILARGGFAQGLLLGKNPKQYLSHSQYDVQYVASCVEDLAIQYSISKESVLLAFLLKYQNVTSTLVGIRTEQQLDNILLAQNEIQNLSINFETLKLPQILYTDHIH
ncbi:aldo/keto reductase [Sphingobacterium bovistauri]|uniref:Aldo/keto reductase n=1 Tax=Sphingobacterium bovistauri TaxID=2781959 RepID=A0ABS7Z4D5_9SPHI|nr:aldo/keto reductase [Sphingobacterium bovistauri]MCA5003629.1 aldo/keto reductase [Sphingobacterium bovistauri]